MKTPDDVKVTAKEAEKIDELRKELYRFGIDGEYSDKEIKASVLNLNEIMRNFGVKARQFARACQKLGQLGVNDS
jgi:hypothetical protein